MITRQTLGIPMYLFQCAVQRKCRLDNNYSVDQHGNIVCEHTQYYADRVIVLGHLNWFRHAHVYRCELLKHQPRFHIHEGFGINS
jgi:hypothetical protein